MKLKLDKKQFKKHIDNISRGIVSYSPLPALQGVLIEANESLLVLTTSDGYLSIKEEIQNSEGVIIKEPGKVLVPGKLFKEIIDKMGDTIEIEATETKMIVTSDETKTEINLFNFDDYPKISFDSFGKDIVLNAEEFKEIIKNVSFAAAVDDKRVILNGVNIKSLEGKMIVSATNSFRMAREIKEIDSPIDFDITILAKKIRDFLPSGAKGDITINVDDSKIISKIDSTIISSRIIDGVYLPIEKLISNEFSTKVIIDSKELEKNIDRVTVVSGEGKKIVNFKIESEQFTVSSIRSEIGEAKSNVEEFTLTGEPIDIIFDYQFLKDAISKYEGKIVIAFNGPQKPFIIKGESNPNLMQLVMPQRTF